VRRFIVSMCPARVCRECGKPSKRITDTKRIAPKDDRQRKAKALEPSKQASPGGREEAATRANDASARTLSRSVESAPSAEAAQQSFAAPPQAAPVAPAKQERTAPASAGTIASPSASERRSASALTEASESEDQADPEKWLKQISELRKEGRTKHAADSLAKFRAKYPAYPFPREWLEKP